MVRFLALLLLLATPICSQMPVKLALAPEFMVSDASADGRLPAEQSLRETFEKKADEAFPGRILRLSSDEMISPEERVLVLVPTLRAARMTREVTAGVIDRYEAVVVGDLSLLDPWTNANLFSATRMVAASVDLGRSQAGRRDELLHQAFEAATARWMDACIAQLKERATPFVLDGATITSPIPGGIWPFGAERGVKKGATLRGQGHFARVLEVAPKYSLIRDVAEARRRIPAGERYTISVVDKPTERPEPTVALGWRGPQPKAPEHSSLRTLDADAFLELLGNYLSQAGGLRLLPADPRREAARAQMQRLHDHIARHSQLAQANFLSLEQRETAQAARETPDRRVEMGVLGTYHGTRNKADGSLEHYYRIHLGAAVFDRAGEGEAARYPLHTFLEHTEELAQMEQAGIRELDAHAAWFTVCRNAVIRLAAKVQADLLAIPAGDLVAQEGVADAQGRPQWKTAPARFTPLQWFRPSGELKDVSGRSLGILLLPHSPSKGFLNLGSLRTEHVLQGDVLRFSGSPAPEPLLVFAPPVLEPLPDWLLDGQWLVPMAAQALKDPGGCRFLVAEEPVATGTRLVLQAGAFASNTVGDTTTFSGQWRIRLQGEAETPLLKFGLQTDHAQRLDRPADALRPLDSGAWAMDYVRDSLRRLAESATKKNLNQAILASQQEHP